MLKNIIKNYTLLLSLLFTPALLLAESSSFYSTYKNTSLVAFEGGYSTLTASRATPPFENFNENFGFGGFKIGAQSNSYRIYLGFRHYDIQDYDYANAMGAEIEYLMPFNDTLGFYFGLGGGLMNLKFDSTEGKREFSTPYLGVNFGFDVDVSELIALQLGTRFVSINSENTLVGSLNGQPAEITYKVDNMLNAYASLVFKFTLD